MIRRLRNSFVAGIELIKTLLHQASAQGSRSTALYPLAWAFTLDLATLIAAIWERAPSWVPVLLAVLAAVLLGAYLIAYFYFMVKNPDALRSENFTLSKMQIERSQIGDTSRGFQEIETVVSVPVLPSSTDGE